MFEAWMPYFIDFSDISIIKWILVVCFIWMNTYSTTIYLYMYIVYIPISQSFSHCYFIFISIRIFISEKIQEFSRKRLSSTWTPAPTHIKYTKHWMYLDFHSLHGFPKTRWLKGQTFSVSMWVDRKHRGSNFQKILWASFNVEEFPIEFACECNS